MKEGLNLQEISWCETYLRTLSIKQACTESGIRIKEASIMLDKPIVKQYIMVRSDQHRKALEREKEEELSRDKIAKVLENLILDPLTPVDARLRAISQLNSMKEFDKKENIKPEDEQEEVKPKLSGEEAEALLKKMRQDAEKAKNTNK